MWNYYVLASLLQQNHPTGEQRYRQALDLRFAGAHVNVPMGLSGLSICRGAECTGQGSLDVTLQRFA